MATLPAAENDAHANTAGRRTPPQPVVAVVTGKVECNNTVEVPHASVRHIFAAATASFPAFSRGPAPPAKGGAQTLHGRHIPGAGALRRNPSPRGRSTSPRVQPTCLRPAGRPLGTDRSCGITPLDDAKRGTAKRRNASVQGHSAPLSEARWEASARRTAAILPL